MDKVRELADKLHYRFNDIALLEQALSHRSFAKENNERLEFLGDAILSFIIADRIYAQFPQAKEGELSRLRANLVNGEVLADLGNELGLQPYLNLGQGELRSGGSQRRSIIADTVEALIGAIYLDADLETCRTCVLTWFTERLASVTAKQIKKDAKTRLQELLQAQHIELPVYQVLAVKGAAHDQTFTISCYVAHYEHTTEGEGSSRRRAEQVAATEFLTYLDNRQQSS